MARKFISFLGTGKYEKCHYTLQDKKIENVDIFIIDNVAYNIINKMIKNRDISLMDNSKDMLATFISARNPFGFTKK